MIKYATFNEFTDYNQIKTLWNDELQKIYPISDKLFLSSVVNNKEIIKDNSYVALNGNQVIGFIIAKGWQESEMIPYYNQLGWISLFYVKGNFRKQGIGSHLLQSVEQGFKDLNKTRILLGTDTYNFFPGLPVDLINYKQWFIKRGFVSESESYDMIRHFNNSDKLPIPETPYEVRVATLNDKEAIMKFFTRCFKGRWEYEANNYFQKGGTGREFIIALDKEKVIAFARINDKNSPEVLNNINWSDRFENLSGVGPLGVDPEYRKKKLGYIVTAYAVNEAQSRGSSDCIIDWTGLVDFYRLFKFEVWKSHSRLDKKIN